MKNGKWLYLIVLVVLILTLATCYALAAKREPPTKITMALRSNANRYVEKSPDINNDIYVKELERLFNVDLDITLTPHNAFPQKVALILASGDIPDILHGGEVYQNYMDAAVRAGVFLPLDGLLKKHGKNLLKNVPKAAWDEGTDPVTGKIVAIPEYLSITARRTSIIRKDLLEKHKLDVPKTVDDYYKVLKKFKEGGLKYPFAGREKFKYSEEFFGAYNALPNTWLLNSKKEVVPAYIMPQMKDALAYYRKLYAEGLMDAESFTNNSTTRLNKMYNGDVGIAMLNINEIPTTNLQLKAKVPGAEYMLTACPTGPDGKGGSHAYSPVVRSYYISAKTKQPEKVMQFMDKFQDPKYKDFLTYGFEGKFYTKQNSKINFTYPTDPAGDEEIKVLIWLPLVQDSSAKWEWLPTQVGGKEVANFYQKVAPKNVRHYIYPVNLKSLEAHPELRVDEDQQQFFYQFATRVVMGTEPLENFDKFVQEYLDRGGREIIKEATEQYNKGKAKMR